MHRGRGVAAVARGERGCGAAAESDRHDNPDSEHHRSDLSDEPDCAAGVAGSRGAGCVLALARAAGCRAWRIDGRDPDAELRLAHLLDLHPGLLGVSRGSSERDHLPVRTGDVEDVPVGGDQRHVPRAGELLESTHADRRQQRHGVRDRFRHTLRRRDLFERLPERPVGRRRPGRSRPDAVSLGSRIGTPGKFRPEPAGTNIRRPADHRRRDHDHESERDLPAALGACGCPAAASGRVLDRSQQRSATDRRGRLQRQPARPVRKQQRWRGWRRRLRRALSCLPVRRPGARRRERRPRLRRQPADPPHRVRSVPGWSSGPRCVSELRPVDGPVDRRRRSAARRRIDSCRAAAAE